MLDAYKMMVLLKVADRALREHYFAPLGLSPPHLPVTFKPDSLYDIRANSASTRYHGTDRPQEMYINLTSPDNQDAAEMVGSYAHELIHAVLPFHPRTSTNEEAHGPLFQKVMHNIDLQGDPMSSSISPKFRKWFDDVVVPAYKEALNNGE
jgi:hypothetical protein